MGLSRRLRGAMATGVGLVVLGGLWLPVTARAATADGATWGIVPSQDASATDNRLYSVACSDASTCWAVGTEWNGSVYQTLVEQATPSGWEIVASPDNSSTATTDTNENNVLTSVTCLPSGPCFAAGYWYDGQNQAHTMVIENNGSGWSLMTTADTAPAVVDDFLNGITCLSATDCWAVGESVVPGVFFIPNLPFPGTPGQTLTEHWDGTQWSIQPSANNNANESVLQGVSCVSTSDCYAVGIDASGSSTYNGLVEQWNGTTWSIVTSAQPSAQENQLDGAWCAADGTCHATGIERTTSATQTLTESATASAGWTDDHGADTAADRLNGTTGITCTDDSDCWSVGEYDSNGRFLFQTLIQQRTAAGWAVVPSANASTTQPDQLWGVGCANAATCYAVGYSTDAADANHTLIESLQGPSAQVPEMPTPLLLLPVLTAAVAVRRRLLPGGLDRHRRAAAQPADRQA